jgi:predicted AlkP superfamily pyrophosphatase or phosphodiesterase
MNKPNYQDGSIVNLVSSIQQSFGKKSLYNPLKDFDISEIGDKNIVLIVLDGLGYKFLTKQYKDSFLAKHTHSKITSVFPATTSAAMTALSIGLPPQQHALTGWYMYFKEIGTIASPLPFNTRSGGFNLTTGGVNYNDLIAMESVFKDLDVTSIVIKHEDYIHSEFSQSTDEGSIPLPYTDFNGFIEKIKEGIELNNKRKYIWAYWPSIDSLSHKFGTDSEEVSIHFKEVDKALEDLSKWLVGKDTTILLTADHGLMDTKEEEKIILLENYPEFLDMLALPLTGEPRATYCYVRPDRVDDFENYVNTEFKDICELYKSQDLIDENYFGLYEPNPKLKDRVGDYTLIMKDNYIMKDLVLGDDRKIFIGNHGGLSDEELFVPLVVIE